MKTKKQKTKNKKQEKKKPLLSKNDSKVRDEFHFLSTNWTKWSIYLLQLRHLLLLFFLIYHFNFFFLIYHFNFFWFIILTFVFVLFKKKKTKKRMKKEEKPWNLVITDRLSELNRFIFFFYLFSLFSLFSFSFSLLFFSSSLFLFLFFFSLFFSFLSRKQPNFERKKTKFVPNFFEGVKKN